MRLFDELKWRGIIESTSSPDLEEKLNNGGMTFYIGTDPTGESLHIGHYSSFLVAKRLKDAGHHPILLVGGATGLIGDPKPNAERPMITKKELEENYKKLRKQVEDIFGFEVVNNYDWSKDINFIDYLRDYGKYFSLNYMLAKETVKSRLDIGITYTEFSYMILQALDFLYLFENKNCTLQIGGQDQWGNITAGVELIRKKTGKEAYAFTMPLITKADGTKFGKSEGNAVWLDKNKTTPYEFYQFLINTEDSKIIEYLKKLTFLSKEEIELLETSLENEPHLRLAHKKLAEEVITFIHSKEEFDNAVKISESLFNGNIKDINSKDLVAALKYVPGFILENEQPIIDVLINNEICSSRREVREFINSGSITVNDEKVTDENLLVTKKMAIEDELIIIKRGKKKYYIGKFAK